QRSVDRGQKSEIEGSMIESYRDLRVYQISYELALEVHKLTLKFPDFEKYELGIPEYRGQKPEVRTSI
ncbi:four helix bundle protein, partial [Desulfosporosinus sp. OT]|uniref:four helix bundle protein n=1 Tax=Desulfosporosinus sp. OT TaxID=913865 RepID=UPI00249DBC8B